MQLPFQLQPWLALSCVPRPRLVPQLVRYVLLQLGGRLPLQHGLLLLLPLWLFARLLPVNGAVVPDGVLLRL